MIRTRRVEVIKEGTRLMLKVHADDAMTTWKLSKRERNVCALMLVGRRNVDVGKTLFIAPKTVSTYRSRLLMKAGVDNWEEFVYLATKLGILYSDPVEG